MKRKHVAGYSKKTGDIKKDLSPEQLAGIGAVALAYNAVERRIDDLFSAAAGLKKPLAIEISTRINGIDGKIEIIKAGAQNLDFNKAELRALEGALGKGVFGRFKEYRDGIIHTSVINAPFGIGLTIGKRATLYDVLLTKKALDAFYAHLVALDAELTDALNLLLIAPLIRKALAKDDPDIASYEGGRRACSVRFLARSKDRLSLPPIPEFPPESELREADFQFQQERQAALMGWFFSDLTIPQRPPQISAALWSTLETQTPPLPLTETEAEKKR